MADARGYVDDHQQQLHDQQLPEKDEEEKKTHISQNLRVLALDDSDICLKILAFQLRKCGYQVTATKEASKALELLRTNKDAYDIVITDVVRSDIDGFKLLEIIGLEWDIPVIMTSADDHMKTVEKGIRHGARDYLVKPVRVEILQNIWQHVIRKMVYHPVSNSNAAVVPHETNGNANPNEQLRGDEDVSGQSTEESPSPPQKKPRVVWESALHEKFVAAVQLLDIDKAVPKKILELMNEPNLTRENVASHLQKYRKLLKETKGRTGQEMIRNPVDGMSHFYNPIIPVGVGVGNHGLNHNNGHEVSSFTGSNPSVLPLNYNEIVVQQRRLLSQDVHQRGKNIVIPVLQNVSPGTALTTDSGSSAMKYQNIQNQRNMVDHNYGQISSQLTATGMRYPESFPNLIAGNASGSLPMLSSRPYSYSSVSKPAVPHQVGYTQSFPADSSVRENNGHLSLPFPAASSPREINDHHAQLFLPSSSVGENNSHLALPFPAAREINGYHAQPFPSASSVGEKNGHLALPFPAASSMRVNNCHVALPFPGSSYVRQNNGHHVQSLPTANSFGLKNGTNLALPVPGGSSARENNDTQTIPAGSSIKETNSRNALPFPADSSVRGNTSCHAPLLPADSSARENTGDHGREPLPANSIIGNISHEMEMDDELTFMVKQFANYHAPSI